MKKFKISTFISQHVTENEKASAGFAAAIMFLPELYLAHQNPTECNLPEGTRTVRDVFLHKSNVPEWYDYTDRDDLYFDTIQECFKKATRLEMHILPGGKFTFEFFNQGQHIDPEITLSFSGYDDNNDFNIVSFPWNG